MSVCCSGPQYHWEEKTNTFSIGTVTFEAQADRLIILEDEFRSGMGCPRCNPKGTGNALNRDKFTVACDNCDGKGSYTREGIEKKCSSCEGLGKVVCPDCRGAGTSTGIVLPETATKRPGTGKVVSAGPSCLHTKLGESVLYSNFAGYVIDLSECSIRIIHESEVLAKVNGHLEFNRLNGKTELATYNP
jgi:co-chaperonin GroES (HSP10)